MKISRTHFYEKKELKNIINGIYCTPVADIAKPIRDWLDVEDRGEYLMNILDDYDIRRLEEYLAGD